MMHITKKSRYAVRALVGLALREDGAPTPLAELARSCEVPFQFLEQIFAQLRRAGIVTAKRGVKGGYLLAGDPGEISVLSVIEALDGPITPADCAAETSCSRRSKCSASTVWLQTKQVVEDHLSGVSIGQLAAGGVGSAAEFESTPASAEAPVEQEKIG